jgi:hypothetical protein
MEKTKVKKTNMQTPILQLRSAKIQKNAEDVFCKERAKSNRYQINAIVNGGFVNVQLVAT